MKYALAAKSFSALFFNMGKVIKRRRYDETFKREAVQKLCEGAQPTTAIASMIGTSQCNLHKWKKKYGSEVVKKIPAAYAGEIESNEIKLLKQEIATIKENLDVLRKIVIKSLNNKMELDEG
jgi:transposase-like protein